MIRSKLRVFKVHWEFGDLSAISFSTYKKARKKRRQKIKKKKKKGSKLNIMETFHLEPLPSVLFTSLVLMGWLPCEKATGHVQRDF